MLILLHCRQMLSLPRVTDVLTMMVPVSGGSIMPCNVATWMHKHVQLSAAFERSSWKAAGLPHQKSREGEVVVTKKSHRTCSHLKTTATLRSSDDLVLKVHGLASGELHS